MKLLWIVVIDIKPDTPGPTSGSRHARGSDAHESHHPDEPQPHDHSPDGPPRDRDSHEPAAAPGPWAQGADPWSQTLPPSLPKRPRHRRGSDAAAVANPSAASAAIDDASTGEDDGAGIVDSGSTTSRDGLDVWLADSIGFPSEDLDVTPVRAFAKLESALLSVSFLPLLPADTVSPDLASDHFANDLTLADAKRARWRICTLLCDIITEKRLLAWEACLAEHVPAFGWPSLMWDLADTYEDADEYLELSVEPARRASSSPPLVRQSEKWMCTERERALVALLPWTGGE